MAAVYWESGEPDKMWFQNMYNKGYETNVINNILDTAGCKKVPLAAVTPDNFGRKCDSAVFATPAGSIWFNLMVFCLNALVAIATLEVRRRRFGGELGGPKKGFLGQQMSGYILIG